MFFFNPYDHGAMGILVGYYGASKCFWRDGYGGYIPNTIGRLASEQYFEITKGLDGRLVVHSHYHNGWHHPIPYKVTGFDDELRIDITIFPGSMRLGDIIFLMSDAGVLTQIPELVYDGFDARISSHTARESFFINYTEREGSMFWDWLINPDNAWRLNIINPYPEVVTNAIAREITNELWDEWGLQAFTYGGDVLFVGKINSISQIPEFKQDEFYFELEVLDDFEAQYIMYHERATSALWKLFIQYLLI